MPGCIKIEPRHVNNLRMTFSGYTDNEGAAQLLRLTSVFVLLLLLKYNDLFAYF